MTRSYEELSWKERAELHAEEGRSWAKAAHEAKIALSQLPRTAPKDPETNVPVLGYDLSKEVARVTAFIYHDLGRARWNADMAKFCLDMHREGTFLEQMANLEGGEEEGQGEARVPESETEAPQQVG